jgi:hypothetical protein
MVVMQAAASVCMQGLVLPGRRGITVARSLLKSVRLQNHVSERASSVEKIADSRLRHEETSRSRFHESCGI